jgi:hypothetical protein
MTPRPARESRGLFSFPAELFVTPRHAELAPFVEYRTT